MSFFDKLFGRSKPEAQKKPPAPFKPATLPPRNVPKSGPQPQKSNEELRKDPNLIAVFDKFGREMFITKEDWRKNVLPGTIQSQWNNPDQLYGIIVDSLNGGFRSDVVAVAQQLYKIDKQVVRGACVWGIVLTEEGRLAEAEKVFQDFIATHGKEGVILTNLAKVYARRKDDAQAEKILWHGLELDPNQDNGLGWYWIMQKERGGEEAGREALRRIAALPGSWRAQLWLAREALQHRRPEEAMELYRGCLTRIAKPAPADMLMQMSGDLGNAGHLPEIIEFVEPLFDVKLHGLQVGNNLIKAYLDLGQLDAARKILDQLFAENRLDWRQTLSFWDTEIAKARIGTSPVEQEKLQVAMLTGEGSIWLQPSSPAAELFPAKATDSVVVSFLGSSVEIASNSKRIERQLADTRGRLTRALPLFFAEQVEFNTHARTQTLMPWITNGGGGFVLAGAPWKDEEAAHHSRQGALKGDYVVVSHLKSVTEPWTVELRLIRSIDAQCLATATASFNPDKPQDGIPALAQQLLELLGEHAEIDRQPAPGLYQVPPGQWFPIYLLRLEQLLAVRCGGMDGVPPGFLNGEREIIDGNLQLCVEFSQNVGTRILLAQTLVAMKRVRPDVLREYKEKITLLQKEKPLAEPAQSIVQRMLNEVITL